MIGDRSSKANFRMQCKKYDVENGLLRCKGLPVLMEADFEKEVKRLHGEFGRNHLCGLRKVESELRKKWHCIGLRVKLEMLCREKCFQCHLSCGGICWFRVQITQFSPVSDDFGKEICRKYGFEYVGVPTIEFKLPFRSPLSVDVISANGNCVFLSLLHAVGADKKDHGLLRCLVFDHLKRAYVADALKSIYQDGFEDCLKHREDEEPIDNNVCGIVIHAAASLLNIDIIVHWEAEDGKNEWMLGLASMKKKLWATHQIALRFANDHVDVVTKFK